MNTSTYSNEKPQELSIETLKKAADMVMKKEEKPLPKKLDWFTRFMNRHGWHRQYEVIILDKSKFGMWDPFVGDVSKFK